VVECLLCKYKSLSWNHSPTKKKRKKKKKKETGNLGSVACVQGRARGSVYIELLDGAARNLQTRLTEVSGLG
jgi:hypothetical protein